MRRRVVPLGCSGGYERPMTNSDEPDETRWVRFVRGLVAQMSDAERAAMLHWAQEILEIKKADISARAKVRRAVELTQQSSIISPALRVIGKELKRIGWDDRGLPARIGLSSAAATISLFGGAGSGLALFGGAIAVPLWLLFGTGGLAIGALINELRAAKTKGPGA